MRTLVVYDSLHGNTEAIAHAIGKAIPGDVQVLPVRQVTASQAAAVDLLVVGTPTHGGRPTESLQPWLDSIGAPARQGAQAATFDTRFGARWVKIFGFPAPRMADMLKKKGWTPVGTPEGFVVEGRQGPLKEGELERAANWAQGLVASAPGELS
jgi:flavodoxin